MDSIKVPDDIKILKFLSQRPSNRYKIKEELKMTYPSVLKKVDRLEKMGLIFVVNEKEGRGPSGKVPYYLITSDGRSVLEGFRSILRFNRSKSQLPTLKEAERRE